ncbi:neuronal membrane glycoprotein M6-a isoform X2 [Parasteatoda tepidariorum]|uniref:neuronal membrane glycoprotein M6-a isoform X2 n=1 Tax=Parasteatoda tepidariorum TaxID=114398 RepID=UPI00077FD825|nr:neuronal membrane glycoprotein M6-a isoform X2 [Parasteatoda tepidariorum]
MFRKAYSYSSVSEEPSSGCCRGSCRCLTRIPYATLIATVLCCTGVGIFLGSFYRGISLTLRTFEEVFHFQFDWLIDLHIVFIIIGGVMGAFSLILLLVGFLATGATREKIYRGFKSRIGGRLSCAFFMGLTYILELVWLIVFVSLVLITFVFSVWWGMCNNLKYEPNPENRCIDLKPLAFMFPNGTDMNLLRICDGGKQKNFCKDCVEPAEVLFIVALAASFLVVLSLIHYLMCLSANYARIKDNEKFQELQELQFLQDTEMGTLSKDRF